MPTVHKETLPLGNSYPEAGATSSLRFPYLTWDEFVTRTLFSEVSRMAGLTPFPGESWHVSSGDLFATAVNGQGAAKYAPIRGFNRADGEIEPLPESEWSRDFPTPT